MLGLPNYTHSEVDKFMKECQKRRQLFGPLPDAGEAWGANMIRYSRSSCRIHSWST